MIDLISREKFISVYKEYVKFHVLPIGDYESLLTKFEQIEPNLKIVKIIEIAKKIIKYGRLKKDDKLELAKLILELDDGD